MAARVFATDDYLELKRSTRLWYDPPLPGQTRLEIVVPAETPTIFGTVGHEGGLWVHPEYRKRGLSVILPHLIRAFCLRQWDVDWQTGLTLREIGECGIAKWAYGMPHVVPCFEGFSPLRPIHDRLFIAYMDRRELLAGLSPDTVTRLFADRHSKTSHPAALVQKG
jgi:GNAT superfamily N-acetyltransferase